MIAENPDFIVDGASAIRQRLKIAGEAVTAGQRALKEWGCSVDMITHLVFVSSGELRMPGGDVQVAIALGLSSDVNRIKLYMLGCSGGANGMRVAKDIAENNSGSRVLLVTSETTVVGFRALTRDRPDVLVWQALFGDGAAAMVIGADPIAGVETAFFELSWAGQTVNPGTEEVIEGTISEDGHLYKIGRELPERLESSIDDEFARKLLNKIPGRAQHEGKYMNGCSKSRNGFHQTRNGFEEKLQELTYNDLFWAVHPGGPAILDAVEKGLHLAPEAAEFLAGLAGLWQHHLQ